MGLASPRRPVLSPSFYPSAGVLPGVWAGASPVRVLLGERGPAAIAWFVVPGRVRPAVKRHALRPVAHVSEETAEFKPSFADSDAAATVVRVRGVPLVEAPGDHPGPGVMRSFVLPPADMTRKLPVHLLRGLLGQDGLSFFRMMLPGERMVNPRVMAREVLSLPLDRVCAAAAKAGFSFCRLTVPVSEVLACGGNGLAATAAAQFHGIHNNQYRSSKTCTGKGSK